MEEGTLFDKKSLKTVVGKSVNFNELAKDCVAFANAKGGHIYIGIEDDNELPNPDQKINQAIADQTVKNLNERTVNVAISATICSASNGGEFIDLNILPSKFSIASTTKGSYFLRDNDTSRPLWPDELSRLQNDKPSYCWETKVSAKYKFDCCDQDKLASLVDENALMTNLGILWVGTQMQRSHLLYSPIVQYIKYDEEGNKINKIVWDDYSKNPYRLRALIIEDLRFHPNSLWSEISRRLPDVNVSELQKTIRRMANDGEITGTESRKYRRYRLP